MNANLQQHPGEFLCNVFGLCRNAIKAVQPDAQVWRRSCPLEYKSKSGRFLFLCMANYFAYIVNNLNDNSMVMHFMLTAQNRRQRSRNDNIWLGVNKDWMNI